MAASTAPWTEVWQFYEVIIVSNCQPVDPERDFLFLRRHRRSNWTCNAVPEEDLIIADQSSTKIRRGRSLRGEPGAARGLRPSGSPKAHRSRAQAATSPGERRPTD
ncbi:hypothetical protein EYF80_057059 [Liparis tanakae]|uniref:Uncharacterized protein n=1 Tax=Liparis tanakae TaxID=230148 RepID=A0A4Z2EV59_9TELE|nr:hypothetical protein EYF80_057059 [Liparis tanakae]